MGYRPPEGSDDLESRAPLDPSLDIWSLGITMLQMLHSWVTQTTQDWIRPWWAVNDKGSGHNAPSLTEEKPLAISEGFVSVLALQAWLSTFVKINGKGNSTVTETRQSGKFILSAPVSPITSLEIQVAQNRFNTSGSPHKKNRFRLEA